MLTYRRSTQLLAVTMMMAALTLLGLSVSFAQEPEPVEDMSLKYELREHEDGYVRMNRETGEVSYCRVLTGSLVCRLGAEERRAYEEKIAVFEDRIDRAEARIEALEMARERKPRRKGERSRSPDRDTPQQPSQGELDREFDEAMEIARSAMRRFFDAVQDLRSEFENR